jgi:hypothetical protein
LQQRASLSEPSSDLSNSAAVSLESWQIVKSSL